MLGEEHGAAVICLQEHHLVFDQSIAVAQATLQAAGWRGFFSPATQAPGATHESHSSGGVAVLVREEFSAHHAAVIIPGRAIGVEVSLPQLSAEPIFVISAYLHAGHGVDDANKEVASDLGCALSARSGPWAIAGDWQATPEQVLSIGFPVRSGGRLLATPGSQGTCRAASGSFRRIDFFVVSNGLAELSVATPSVVPRRANPHLPVVADFAGNLGSTFGTVFQGLSRLSSTRVYGPIFEADPPCELPEAIRLAQLAVTSKDPSCMAEKTDGLYRIFLQAARRDVAYATGEDPGCFKGMGQFVRKPASVIDRRATFKGNNEHSAHAWVLDRLVDMHQAWIDAERPAEFVPGSPFFDSTAPWRRFVSIASSLLTNPPAKVARGPSVARQALDNAVQWARRLLGGPIDPSCRSLLGREVAIARGQRKAISNRLAEDSRSAWSTWAKQALVAGAGAAHAFVKQGDKHPVLSDRPSVFKEVAAEFGKWSQHWGPPRPQPLRCLLPRCRRLCGLCVLWDGVVAMISVTRLTQNPLLLRPGASARVPRQPSMGYTAATMQCSLHPYLRPRQY